jgi:hypothetical protein
VVVVVEGDKVAAAEGEAFGDTPPWWRSCLIGERDIFFINILPKNVLFYIL